MHGCSLGNAPLVNAEVDSMGGVVDSGVGIGARSSPQRAAIEKAQAELRREYDVREERRRELEFLEKGGNPLDFKFGNAASISVQSTSLTDQPPEQLVTSEAKGSFALTASPPGDSVESSGRPEAPVVSEPNCADNLLLFDGENDSVDGGRSSIRFVRSKTAPSEQTFQLDSGQNAKESGESPLFGLPKSRAYKRRNRSRPNREGARSSSTDIVPSRGGHVSSLPSRDSQKDMKGSMLDTDNRQIQNASLNNKSTHTISNGAIDPTDLPSDVVGMVLDSVQAVDSVTGSTEVGVPKLVPDCEQNLVSSPKSDVGKEPSAVVSEFPESVEGRQQAVSPHLDCPPLLSIKSENQTGSVQQNGVQDTEGDEGRTPIAVENCNTSLTTKDLDLGSRRSETGLGLDKASDIPVNGLRSDDIIENTGVEVVISSESPNVESDKKLNSKDEKEADDRYSPTQDGNESVCKDQDIGSSLRPEEELHQHGSGSQEEANPTISVEGMKVDGISTSDIEKKPENLATDNLDPAKENVCYERLGGCTDKPALDASSEKESAHKKVQDASVPEPLSQPALPSRDSSDAKLEVATETQLKLDVRAHEDSILKEARVIEAKRKRIAQLSVGAFTSENHQNSQWDFVLEEMAWMANDFAQERLWKISVAAQLSNRVASASRERLTEKNSLWKQKKVAHTLSKAIMEFWFSAEELSKGSTMQCPLRNSSRGVQEYAVRYLKYNTSLFSLCLAELPATPERIYELENQELSWEERFTEENLFYTVPLGAVETYRKAIEFHLAKIKRTGSSIQEEVETSLNGAAAGHGSQGNAFEEDEGETNAYLLSGDAEIGKPSKFAQKKRNLIISSSAKSYDKGTNIPFMQRMENKFGTPQPGLTVKRPANNVHVNSIPTKRMRTAPRPRFTTPLTAGTSGGNQVPNKPDGSSGDNNSFQDDHSTFQGGSQIPDNMEVESVADFEMQLPFDSAESKPKKKKKPKHQGSTYEQRWQHGNNLQNELGGYSRKRYDKLVESNGSSGLYGQPIMKKQKMMRQPMDNSLDKYSPVAGSIPSPVASQMSNMAHSNKLVKILGGGNRGKKGKSLKMHVGQSGPGSPWSSFEEQALIVLVHDLGPNWELISDAINNILQYKCIFRKPKECSEHHKELLSRTAGDGADSAEDSGSSQPYPSTLPGIPKGSARALFQRLQEPIEEDMIKVHFEKIIQMSQKQRLLKMQNENQEQKPIQPHSSHAVALSQACPNNISGGPLLTPLDLCDLPDASPDVLSGGYQGTLGSGLATSTQSGSASLHPTSGINSVLQGSPNMVHANNFSSPSNSSMRDGRYVMPRLASLSVDDQRMQQYNQAMPGRVAGTSSGTDRGVRMMAGGNGMGVMCGMNRNMSMPRPGFPGIAPSSVLNSGMLPSNMAVLAEPSNLHSGAGASPGNSILRPRDSSNMMRPTQIPQHQRQMMVPDHQMQATQGNIQGVPPFGGISGGFPNQTSPSSSQTHPFHHQQHRSSQQQAHVHDKTHHPHLQGSNHASSPQHQAYAIRLAKERHLQLQQQRVLHQQQLAASGGSMPRGPPQTQGSLQNSSHVQPSASVSVSAALTPSSSSMPPMAQHQQKPHMPAHGLTGNPQSGGNQMGKQRQRQLQQQLQNSHPHSGRQHPQQRTHPQHHAKLVKGAGRGNMATHQNLTVEPSILNGLSQTTGSQSTEKGEQVTNIMQGQGLYPGSGLNPTNPSYKALAQQQKIHSGQAMASSKQSQQQASHLDKKNQGHASPSTSGNTLPTSHQAASPSVTSSSNSQQLQPTQKLANQSQAPVQRVLQQNRQMNSDSLASKLQADRVQSEQLHVTNSCINPAQSGTTEVSSHPSGELVIVKPVVPSTSGTQGKAPEQQCPIVPKPGNSLISLSRTQSQEGRASVAIPTQPLDVGLQRLQQKSQLQTSSSPPPLPSEQQPLPAQQLQTGTNNLHVNPGSTDHRLD